MSDLGDRFPKGDRDLDYSSWEEEVGTLVEPRRSSVCKRLMGALLALHVQSASSSGLVYRSCVDAIAEELGVPRTIWGRCLANQALLWLESKRHLVEIRNDGICRFTAYGRKYVGLPRVRNTPSKKNGAPVGVFVSQESGCLHDSEVGEGGSDVSAFDPALDDPRSPEDLQRLVDELAEDIDPDEISDVPDLDADDEPERVLGLRERLAAIGGLTDEEREQFFGFVPFLFNEEQAVRAATALAGTR